MDSRIKDTIVRHDKGFNCAQAVACTYCDLLGYKEEDIFRMTEGFGAGMGGMQATCGALSGAVLLAGLKNSDGAIDAPKTKAAVKLLSDFGVNAKSLFITADEAVNVERSTSNIPGVKAITAERYHNRNTDSFLCRLYYGRGCHCGKGTVWRRRMSKYKEIKAALLGAGTVGGGVYKLVERRSAEMQAKVGADLKITKVMVKNLQKKREGIPSEVLTDDWESIIHDPEISIVIELMGGVEPARTYILQALEAGKNVVTANKDLLAEHGQELMEAAERNHCDICFEAAVGGGIPIIRPLKECLAGNEITEVMGIVNGTTNYILTKMTQEGWDFDDALKEAQRLGFAEADPTADVEGLDAGRKMAILASIAFHSRVTFKDVDVKGITRITAKDIQYAKEFGYTLKLLGVARNEGGKMEVGVSPMMIPITHPLANVNDSFNAVFVHGDAVDDAMFQGRGAGEFPTASAVVGDIIDVCRNIVHDSCGKIGCCCYKHLNVKNIADTSSKFFLRLEIADRSGVLANIASVLGNSGVSIAQVVQKKSKDGVAELVIITDEVKEKHFNDAMAVFKGLSAVKNIAGVIRVY